ncbi:hypothetical protein IFM89_020783, partial [Coptis chinensis]
GWESRWVKSEWKKDENTAGEWNFTAGKWNGDANDKGIQTSEDYRFYAISLNFELVFRFSVKHEQKLDCGGGYMKSLLVVMLIEEVRWRYPYRLAAHHCIRQQTLGTQVLFELLIKEGAQVDVVLIEQDKWSSAYNVRTILLSIQSLLGEPNTSSPLNNQAAALEQSGRKMVQKLYKPDA